MNNEININEIESNWTNEIDVKANWIEAKMKGNYKCPKCKKVMIIMCASHLAYAFCSNCKTYFIDDEKILRK